MTPEQFVALLKHPAVVEQLGRLLENPRITGKLAGLLTDPAVKARILELARDPDVPRYLVELIGDPGVQQALTTQLATSLWWLVVPAVLSVVTVVGVAVNLMLLLSIRASQRRR